MTKPVGRAVSAFDAGFDHVFYFTSSGGNQIVKNQLTIKNNLTNAVVYQNTVSVLSLSHVVPANTLVNGTQYNYSFIAYDTNGLASEASDPIIFYCYTTPTITFTNIPNDNIIPSSEYNFSLSYAQAEGEHINYMTVTLYNSSGDAIDTSGALYNTNNPPLTFSYDISGFTQGAQYILKARSVSINGTVVEHSSPTLTANYSQPNIYSKLTLANDCEEGCVDITSNLVLSTGIVNPEPAIYRSYLFDEYRDAGIKWNTWYNVGQGGVIGEYSKRYSCELIGSKTVTFSEGFSIPADHQFQLWFQANQNGEISEYFNSIYPTKRVRFSLKHGIPSGETTYKNWVEVFNDDGTLAEYSNYIDEMNFGTMATMWFKKVGSTYTLTLQSYDQLTENRALSWLVDDSYPSTPLHGDINATFPFDTVIIKNGAFDNLDITSNVNRVYSSSYPNWDYYTKLNCKFDGTLSGSNIDILVSQLDGIKIKRRISGDFGWITLKQYTVSESGSINVSTTDYLSPTNKAFDYAIVPTLSGGVEGEYNIQSITSNFRYTYLTDGETTLKFQGGVNNGSATGNINGGMYLPIGSQYPIPVFNANTNYENGSLTADVLGATFGQDHIVDQAVIGQYMDKCRDFINNKKTKILKDWFGKIRMVATSVDNGYSATSNLQTGQNTIQFSWTEVGDWNDQTDLYEQRLTNVSS